MNVRTSPWSSDLIDRGNINRFHLFIGVPLSTLIKKDLLPYAPPEGLNSNGAFVDELLVTPTKSSVPNIRLLDAEDPLVIKDCISVLDIIICETLLAIPF